MVLNDIIEYFVNFKIDEPVENSKANHPVEPMSSPEVSTPVVHGNIQPAPPTVNNSTKAPPSHSVISMDDPTVYVRSTEKSTEQSYNGKLPTIIFFQREIMVHLMLKL